MGGALPAAELVELLETVGFVDVRIGERFECFRGTSVETKLSADLRIGGRNYFARKP